MKYYAAILIILCLNVDASIVVTSILYGAYRMCCTENNKGWFGGTVVFTVLSLVFVPLLVGMWLCWGTMILDVPK